MRISLCTYFFLPPTGPDVGNLGNTKRWKKITPTSFRSPFLCQGDIGFFYKARKRYGIFLVIVQTWTGRIYSSPIANTRANTLIDALTTLLKVRIVGVVVVVVFFTTLILALFCPGKVLQEYTNVVV